MAPQIGQPIPPAPPPIVRIANNQANGLSRLIQLQLSGGAAGNIQVNGNGNGGVVVQPGRNAFGDAFHSAATNPLISPFGALLDRLTR